MRIGHKERISYAMGGFGKNVAYGLVSSYTLYYYNTVLGISPVFVGVLLMAARIFDAFNDPFMGVLVAKTKGRFGKYKPWIFVGSLSNALILYAMFTVPDTFSEGGIKAYIAVTYFLCGITYTLGDIPYWSVIPAVTRAGRERENLTLFARTFSGIGAALPTMVAMAMISFLGGGEEPFQLEQGFSKLALLIAVVYVLTSLMTIRYLPEEHTVSSDESVTVRELLSALIHNDHAMWLAFVIVAFNTAVYMTTNLGVYLFQYDICNYDQYTLFMVLCGGIQFIAMVIIYPLMRRKLSNRTIFMMGCLGGIIGFGLMIPCIGMKSISFSILIMPAIGVSFANGLAYVLTTIFVAGACDYGEKQTGRRDESLVSSLQTLMVKLASAFAVFIAGIGIDLTGLDEMAEMQSQMTLSGMRILFAVPPMILMVLSLFVFRRKKELGLDHEVNEK